MTTDVRYERSIAATPETRLDSSTLAFETEFTVEAVGGGTLMTMIQRGLPTAAHREQHARGVPRALDRLER